MPDPSFRIALRHQAGPLDLDVHFSLTAPWTALFAPSGAGKTTILRLIAGLETPTHGRILTPSGAVLLDTSTRTNLPPHQRRIPLVAQRPALFPHLSVLANIRYSKPAAADDLLHLCRIAHLRNHHPAQLSGGERQRVAIARALAAPATLLLLDEPFTGLESTLRDDLIRDLRLWCTERNIPVLLVTHDLAEVFTANAQVLKMDAGRITAQGPAAQVLALERTHLIARLTQNSQL
jgi:molybdate transport system ATP-binding protein